MLHRIIAALAVALLLAPLAPAQDIAGAVPDSIDLRPIWQTGQTSRYRLSSERLTTAQVLNVGKPRSTGMKVLADVTWQVTDADPDGGGACRMTIDRMVMLVSDAQGQKAKITRDSAPEKLKSAQTLLRAMIDKPLTVKVAPDGSVRDVAGWESIRNNAGEAGKNLTESDFVETATDMALLVGGTAAADVGDAWNEDFNWSHEMGELQLDTTFKLQGIEAIAGIPIATIQADSKVNVAFDKQKLAKANDVKVKLKKGQETGQIIYDPTRHEVVGRNTDRDLVFEMKLNVSGRQFTQVIEQRLNSQVIRLEEKE